MELIINGEIKTFSNNISISNLLKELSIEERVVAISLNLDIVKKELWDQTILKDNDRLELLQFMSGG
ncbi:sulfur carrier protein ThiS [Helicobacter muridarum]|uniref:Sulfur carrier protein ThiS n=1 Tax=Helicobacter muridarum TaxID=216 RepID=A0A099TXD0_9HELI|nr:sulfur carrier protein ThiS [Helicobacter muridarum]TLE00642.1 sulfur carrier protein ThiS [Helicobacter muridarum]STQ85660.1 thiamine biosynthesis protein ThiS [Helicobacter muridarum]